MFRLKTWFNQHAEGPQDTAFFEAREKACPFTSYDEILVAKLIFVCLNKDFSKTVDAIGLQVPHNDHLMISIHQAHFRSNRLYSFLLITATLIKIGFCVAWKRFSRKLSMRFANYCYKFHVSSLRTDWSDRFRIRLYQFFETGGFSLQPKKRALSTRLFSRPRSTMWYFLLRDDRTTIQDQKIVL